MDSFTIFLFKAEMIKALINDEKDIKIVLGKSNEAQNISIVIHDNISINLTVPPENPSDKGSIVKRTIEVVTAEIQVVKKSDTKLFMSLLKEEEKDNLEAKAFFVGTALFCSLITKNQDYILNGRGQPSQIFKFDNLVGPS